uniref:Uncharacterized protein n=1 Tax=Rhizophora mucronata TaxID=61149 RepID=A0A2P2PAC6_RHIMU
MDLHILQEHHWLWQFIQKESHDSYLSLI